LVIIRLATWDAENKITHVDFRVANAVDELYTTYRGDKSLAVQVSR
jgi:pterin-4a-carbinolamine dehydratase